MTDKQQYPGWISVNESDYVRASEVVGVEPRSEVASVLNLRNDHMVIYLGTVEEAISAIQNAELAQQDNMMRHVQDVTRSMMGLRAESFNISPTPDPIAWFARNSPRRSGGTGESTQEGEPAE